jgi:ABC-type dipeptide/oligopeptide/nickel transport system ATPase component
MQIQAQIDRSLYERLSSDERSVISLSVAARGRIQVVGAAGSGVSVSASSAISIVVATVVDPEIEERWPLGLRACTWHRH